jgi:glutamyl-tRNA synthetase
MLERKIRVRFAPSPTGPLHMGGVRTALYNYLFAKKHNGDFILRIEDTDQTRFVPGAEEYIIESLKWCNIEPNEGVGFGDGPYAPYRQSERKSIYRQYAEQLVRSGHAYYAFDTPEELEEARRRMEKAGGNFSYNIITRQSMKNSLSLSNDEVQKRIASGEPYVIRLKVPRKEEVRFHDLIRGWVVVDSAQIDDKVLFKSDGMPTYHLANVVDDYLMKITHVIRGEEWLPSAPLHVLLYRYLGWENAMPQFAHLPLLLRPDGNGKLSKRDGDRLGFLVFPLSGKLFDHNTGKEESFSGYREAGYFPNAFINMIALLGWHPSGNQEIFSLDELVKEFSLERISKHGAKFDPEKAKWFNQQYLRKKSNDEIANIFSDYLKTKLEDSDLKLEGNEKSNFRLLISNFDYVKKVCSLIKEKASFVNEFWSLGSYFFIEPENYDADVIKKRWNEKTKNFIAELAVAYKSATTFSPLEAENRFKQTCEELGIKSGEVMQLFRVCISGMASGPALFETTALLGKETIVKRLEAALLKIK